MTFDGSDPRLSAYALGEMDAREARAFEEELRGNPAARAEVERIRGLARRLAVDLAAEPTPSLLAEDRRRLLERAGSGGSPLRRWAVRGLAAAALVLAGFVLGSHAGLHEGARAERDLLAARSATPPTESGPAVDRDRATPRGAPAPASARKPPSGPASGGRPAAGALPLLGPSAPLSNSSVRPGVSLDFSDMRPADVRPAAPREPGGAFQTEEYARVPDHPFARVWDEDVSTFSIDVDTASYANVRRFLRSGLLPPKDAVRIEELVNAFPYHYAPPPPGAEDPFAWHVAVAACPWAPRHRLVRIALKGRELDASARPPADLVFLLDVSGSMDQPAKLPLVRGAMKLLVDELGPTDRVAIVVYAGAAGLVLPSTPGDRKDEIRAAIDRLHAGGSTAGGAGIELAYRTAEANRIEGGTSRVILCTDGDFNVGVSDTGSLTRLIEQKAKGGVFLTVLGFGTGNLKDARMKALSTHGNGNYAYVDSLREARKVLVEGLGSLFTIAKDVKVQVFFNPAKVASWRLLGYESRRLAKEDFGDDTKDAGEIGAGHAVTALYEIVPAGEEPDGRTADPNPFVTRAGLTESAVRSPALGRLRLRYEAPDGGASRLLEADVVDSGRAFDLGDADFQWAAAVAGAGMLLRDDPSRGDLTWPLVEEIARGAVGDDPGGARTEFLGLLRRAAALSGR